jgi:GxxExxY protein
MNENQIGDIVVETAIDLHKKLGPGLFESVYEIILAKLLTKRGLSVQRQVSVPITFEDEYFEEGFRADIVVNGKVILEIKSIEKLHPVHKKQLLTYLKLTNMKVGYLLNFGEALMKDGIARVINGKIEDTPPCAPVSPCEKFPAKSSNTVFKL